MRRAAGPACLRAPAWGEKRTCTWLHRLGEGPSIGFGSRFRQTLSRRARFSGPPMTQSRQGFRTGSPADDVEVPGRTTPRMARLLRPRGRRRARAGSSWWSCSRRQGRRNSCRSQPPGATQQAGPECAGPAARLRGGPPKGSRGATADPLGQARPAGALALRRRTGCRAPDPAPGAAAQTVRC